MANAVALGELFGSSEPRATSSTPTTGGEGRAFAARDAETPPATLDALSRSNDRSVRRAVASNPNVAPETLMRLAAEFPDELFQNPALPLFLLENPSLFADMPEESLAKLVHHPSMPEAYLLEAARHRAFYVRRAAAQNPRMPPAVLVELAEKQSYFEEVAGNPSTPPDYVARMARHDWPAVRLAAAGNPSLPKEAIPALANDGDAKVRRAVVRSEAATVDVLLRLAEHESALVRLAVAESEKTPRAILDRLAGDADAGVRFAASRTRSKARPR